MPRGVTNFVTAIAAVYWAHSPVVFITPETGSMSGSHVRSEVAADAGARTTDEGCVIVDDHLETTVPGLFGAGVPTFQVSRRLPR